MAVATYPGMVSPLRGLDAFGETERDVWQGRESERDEVARMVSADGFRAGLLYGEPGVGKTSLVRAGLIPHLRDHGIVALACEDLAQPMQSFANGLSAFGIQPNSGEHPIAFMTRAVSNSVAGQQFVFVVDDVDLACSDDRVIGELAEMFAKVVSRSAGRARFLFVAASERMHALGALERRTGSLFPPSNRYELPRLAPAAASVILDRVLSLSGVATDPALAEAIANALANTSGVLTADLQIAAIALRDLRISSAPALHKLGGPRELESAWLHDACRATGDERSALRLCGELATSAGRADEGAIDRTADVGRASEPSIVAKPIDAVARRINLDPEFASHAVGVLEQRGVIARGDATGGTWMLRHEVLVPRVRELAAPARAAARHAFDLLGSKTEAKGRLSLRELRELRRAGIVPGTPAERAVVEDSKRYYWMIAGGILAVPIIALIALGVSVHRHAFYELQAKPGGDRVVVRGGRSSLWTGKVLADTGLSRAMVAPEAWKRIADRELGAPRDGWDDDLKAIIAPQFDGLIEYAKTGSDAAVTKLASAAKEPEDLAELLIALRPLAMGTPAEVHLVETTIALPQPALQRAAVALAGSAAQRHNVYKDTLVQALTSKDPELRRIAFSSVRGLGDRGHALFEQALAKNADPDMRRELLVEVAQATTDDVPSSDAPSVDSAVAVLASADSSAPQRDKAEGQLKAALDADPTAGATALIGLIGNERAPIESRTYAIDALRDLDPLPKLPALVDAAHAAFNSKSAGVRVAALPLYAKVDPERAGGDLATMLDDKKLDKPLRVAAALAWGEVATANHGAAEKALDGLIKDDDSDIRAAAATAAGKLGRTYQDRLVKMAKGENYNVRIGAAEGLAATTLTGGNVGVGVDGIAQLWREKGRPRRDAVKIWAHLARKKPYANVVEYLASATKLAEDPALHPIGVDGLCNAALAGSADARHALARTIDDPSVEVRRLAMSCVADGPDPVKNGSAIAAKLIKDPDNGIRANAARVLALGVGKAKPSPGIADALVQLLDDPNREVRVVAIRAVGSLGGDAPKTTGPALSKLFEHGDEGEKLALLRTAKQVGAADLVGLAVADSSAIVRVAAVDAALGAGLRASATLSAALADADPQVRKAALERLAAQKDKVEPAVLDRALSLAARDPDPELSQLALTTIARVAPKEAVVARLHRALASRVERERAQAAAAAIGLVDRDATLAVQLLEPLLDDPSHDVRVAMLPALAASYAKTNTPEKVADILTSSETDAMRRLVAAAAFVTLAKTDAGRAATEAALKKIDGPPMAHFMASLVAGLVKNQADGMAFLQELVP